MGTILKICAAVAITVAIAGCGTVRSQPSSGARNTESPVSATETAQPAAGLTGPQPSAPAASSPPGPQPSGAPVSTGQLSSTLQSVNGDLSSLGGQLSQTNQDLQMQE